jgi:hypothetical protein
MMPMLASGRRETEVRYARRKAQLMGELGHPLSPASGTAGFFSHPADEVQEKLVVGDPHFDLARRRIGS